MEKAVRKIVRQLLIDDYIKQSDAVTIIDALIESKDNSILISKNSYTKSLV